jgi:hypothetical protein
MMNEDLPLHRAALSLYREINGPTPTTTPSVTVAYNRIQRELHLYVHSSFRDYVRSANRLRLTATPEHPDGRISPDFYPDPTPDDSSTSSELFPLRWHFLSPRPAPLYPDEESLDVE